MIAIIVPFFKINFFKDTLTSLANQKDKRFEVFIFDDNNSSGFSELLSSNINALKYLYLMTIVQKILRNYSKCLKESLILNIINLLKI